MNSIPAGYKQTEVGVIPEDWETEFLGSIFEISAGRDLVKEHFSSVADDKYRYPIYANALSNKGLYGHSKVSQYEADKITVTARGDVGTAVYRSTSFNAIGRLLVLAPKKQCDLRYITEYINNFVEFALESTGVPQLTAPQISKYQVALPPTKAEQEAIAKALSDTDALIDSLEQLITKKRHLKHGAMQELLTGKKRLPGFSGAWEVKRLGDVLSRMANGAVYKQSNSFGIPITRIETISDGTIDYSRTGNVEPSAELEKYKLIPGDILFSHINSLDHIGKVAQFLAQRDLYHGMNLLLLRANKDTDSRFLYFWFTSAPARRKTRNMAKQAVSQASINTTELKELEILMPLLPEQTAIAMILSDMDVEIAALETKLTKTRHLKQGMMHNLLTGRIRLV